MILVTVGTQLPFDRLVRMVDEIAPEIDEEIIAQTGAGRYRSRHLQARAWFDPTEFQELLARTRLLISHAGIGSLLGAQKMRTPLILVPRRAALGEHRNDHQMATVAALGNRAGIYIAHHADDLRAVLARSLVPTTSDVAQPALDRLRASVSAFIAEPGARSRPARR